VQLETGVESLIAERRVRIDVEHGARHRPRRVDDEQVAILFHRVLEARTQQGVIDLNSIRNESARTTVDK